MNLPYSAQGETLLATLTADTTSMPHITGVCLMTATAHNYESQYLFIQLEDGTFQVQTWDDLSNAVSQPRSVSLGLDLPAELKQLRNEGHFLRETDLQNRNVDRKSGIEGRYATIYIVAKTDVEWLMYPVPLRGGEYTNNAVNRIFRAVYAAIYDSEDSFALI